jgi:cell division protein FtsB
VPAGIRWDRLARVSLLIVLAVIVLLYVGPAHTWWVTWREAGAQRSQVQALQAENTRLTARQRELQNPQALEREARKLGMVKRTEHAYVIENLPDGP